ncbi:hypothetical protein EOM57_01715 [Candidatus Saccharibacteria bacterium]|nr:hypothetical protein [Candidatus Saccharibacteria bacterium]
MSAYAEVIRTNRTHEPFDVIKLHGSVVTACRTVHAPEGEAHLTAENVCRRVIDWLIGKPVVTSRDIETVASNALEQYHPDAAYVYESSEAML